MKKKTLIFDSKYHLTMWDNDKYDIYAIHIHVRYENYKTGLYDKKIIDTLICR